MEVAADSRARRWIDLDRIGEGVVLSSSSSAVCRGVDQAVHFGGYGYPPWLYFEIRHQKWFTVEAVDVLRNRSPHPGPRTPDPARARARGLAIFVQGSFVWAVVGD